MKKLYIIKGKGRCDASTAYVMGENEVAARNRLLREDASKYFEIESIRSADQDIQVFNDEISNVSKIVDEILKRLTK